MKNSPEVAVGEGLGNQSGVDLKHVCAVIMIRAREPTSPHSSSTCICCHGGSAIPDTHPEPGGVASACRTATACLTTQHLRTIDEHISNNQVYLETSNDASRQIADNHYCCFIKNKTF